MKNVIYLLLLFAFACSSDEDPVIEQQEARILPNVGIGDIRFGDPGSVALDTYGVYERTTSISGPDGAQFVMWFDNGLAFRMEEVDVGNISLQELVDRSEELIDVEKPIFQMIIMSPFKGVTAEGIGLGSPREDVVNSYGEPDEIRNGTEIYQTLKTAITYSSIDNTIRRMDLDQ